MKQEPNMSYNKTIKEKIKEWRFATCPCDIREPFFWKWSEHGLDMLEAYIKELMEEQRQELNQDGMAYKNLIDRIKSGGGGGGEYSCKTTSSGYVGSNLSH